MTEELHDDVAFEPEDELGSVGAVQAKLKKIKEELEKTKKERQEYLDGWQRCKADSVNARREAQEAGERAASRLRDSLVHDLIPALDSFDMAAASEQWATIDDGFRTGMEHVKNQLIDALERSGIKRFGHVGDMFDPAQYEAVQEEHDGAWNDGQVTRVLRAGYLATNQNNRDRGEKVLRPAQVIVYHNRHHTDS